MVDQDHSKTRRIVGTRLYGMGAANISAPDWMREWCGHALGYADAVLIAADRGCHSLLLEQLYDHESRVTVLLVEPWLGVTHPLNTLVEKALLDGASELILQSGEVWMEKPCIEAMSHHLEENTLVVGAKMSDSHADSTGLVPLTGLTSPWNTMALWNLEKLARTGFLTVSSGLLDGIPGGMEEIVTISLLQQLDPEYCLAKIFTAPGLDWRTDQMKPERRALHEAKMQTKRRRAEQQLRHLGISSGSVLILDPLEKHRGFSGTHANT
uniref:Uncharacterized protein n=1 Tax=Candidatus Kentrum sp. TUN TaxID=2126343 RepID=A0A451A3I1_9GAMM|nr:MAG: hypothetical protein BECKTUN1418D_GA0071000_11307 [Candidatus Kentron sp. TUN]